MTAYISARASSDQSASSSSAGARSARSAAARSSRSIRAYRKSRSEYDLLADSTAGRCGRPAPTTTNGSPVWLISWQAAQRALTSAGARSCISSTNTATPRPASCASPPMSVSSSTRSISMSPESARPGTAATSMPGCQRSRSFGGGRPGTASSRRANDFRTPSTCSAPSRSRGDSSRTARCSAAASGRRSGCSGRASSLPVPQSAPDRRRPHGVEQDGLAHARAARSARCCARGGHERPARAGCRRPGAGRPGRRAPAAADRRRARRGSAPDPRSDCIPLSSAGPQKAAETRRRVTASSAGSAAGRDGRARRSAGRRPAPGPPPSRAPGAAGTAPARPASRASAPARRR